MVTPMTAIRSEDDKHPLAVSTELFAETVAIRRDLHAHPELAFAEHRTAGIVAERLRAVATETHTGGGGIGVVGRLSGAAPGPTIMVRPAQHADAAGPADTGV